MKVETKFDIDEIIYVKNERDGVSKGKICAVGIDMSKPQHDKFSFIYLVWVSDRRDWGGHYIRVYEGNIGRTFDEAYYDADCRFPWEILDAKKQKDFRQFFSTRDVCSGNTKE